MNKNSKTLIGFTVLLFMAMYSIHTPKPEPKKVKVAGTFTMDQAVQFYIDTTGNTPNTEISYMDNLDDFDKNALGVCVTYPDKSQQIILHAVKWETLTNNERIFVVFHELGHCDFDLEHVDHNHDLMSPSMEPETILNFVNNFDNITKLLGGR